MMVQFLLFFRVRNVCLLAHFWNLQRLCLQTQFLVNLNVLLSVLFSFVVE